MFGGAGLYADGVMFALVDEGRIYLKTDLALQADLAAAGAVSWIYTERRGPDSRHPPGDQLLVAPRARARRPGGSLRLGAAGPGCGGSEEGCGAEASAEVTPQLSAHPGEGRDPGRTVFGGVIACRHGCAAGIPLLTRRTRSKRRHEGARSEAKRLLVSLLPRVLRVTLRQRLRRAPTLWPARLSTQSCLGPGLRRAERGLGGRAIAPTARRRSPVRRR